MAKSTYTPKRLRAALQRVGGLSNPSKMPSLSYSLPATMCKVGAKLAEVAGTVCHGCYALKGRYLMPNVKAAMARRFAAITAAFANPSDWIADMTALVAHHGEKAGGFWRWHDSGDVQSIQHLAMIAQVARNTPSIRHWLPTREAQIVRDYVSAFGCPDNLIIRLSASKVDSPSRPSAHPHTSGVHTKCGGTVPDGTYKCPAYSQEGYCNGAAYGGFDCRACWDPEIAHVSYPEH